MSTNAEEGVLHDCAVQYCVARSQHPVHDYFTSRRHGCIIASLLHGAHVDNSALYELLRLPRIVVDDVEAVANADRLGKHRLPVDFVEWNHRISGVIFLLASAITVDEVLAR